MVFAVDKVRRGTPSASLPLVSLSALGVVFGDIGTSPPLYAQVGPCIQRRSTSRERNTWLIVADVWTLVVVTTIKYVVIAMRVDNDGEGGILALMALLGVKRERRPTLVAIGLLGAALIYGDGAITPAISVLSALEGSKMESLTVTPYILPGTMAILLILFAVQLLGTKTLDTTGGSKPYSLSCNAIPFT